MPRGLFITFEGGEGAGKSTQIRRLAEKLRRTGYDTVVTREPGGSPGAEALRHVILSGAAEPFGPRMEALLFAAARSDHVEQVIRPAIERGAIVLCDRFLDSSRVYQGDGGEEASGVRRADRAHHRQRHDAGHDADLRHRRRDRLEARLRAPRRRRSRPLREGDAGDPPAPPRGVPGDSAAGAGPLHRHRRVRRRRQRGANGDRRSVRSA